MQQTVHEGDGSLELPATRQVEITAPIEWLVAGWRDFVHHPLASGFYGLVFVLFGYAVTAASWYSPILVLTFVTGFFLVTPFLALGLYHLSRQGERGEKVRVKPSLFAFTHNKFDMGLLVVFHAVVMIAWIRLTTLVGALYFSKTGTSIAGLIEQVSTTGEGFLVVGLLMLSGGLLAALVFVTSAVSWPMLLDRSSGVINAVATSIKVVRQNKLTMMIWAMWIVSLLSIGLATFYIGLLVIMPVLAHATWHAYRALVE
jgi:uncharacterized membrane protein